MWNQLWCWSFFCYLWAQVDEDADPYIYEFVLYALAPLWFIILGMRIIFFWYKLSYFTYLNTLFLVKYLYLEINPYESLSLLRELRGFGIFWLIASDCESGRRVLLEDNSPMLPRSISNDIALVVCSAIDFHLIDCSPLYNRDESSLCCPVAWFILEENIMAEFRVYILDSIRRQNGILRNNKLTVTVSCGVYNFPDGILSLNTDNQVKTILNSSNARVVYLTQIDESFLVVLTKSHDCECK